MRFDDRLATVLAQPVGSPRDRAIRWRQLVDLVARSGGTGDPALLAEAIAAISADGPGIAEDLRAATARAISGLAVPEAPARSAALRASAAVARQASRGTL